MWKSLALEFKNRAFLSVVPSCDKNGLYKNEMQTHFGMDLGKIPSVALIDSKLKLAELYQGKEFKKEKLSLWTQKHIMLLRKAGPQGLFKELGSGECGQKDANFCLLWLRKMGSGTQAAEGDVPDALRDLSENYKTDPVRLRWVSLEENALLAKSFGGNGSDEMFVLFRPKKGKFKVFKEAFDKRELKSFVDAAVFDGSSLPERIEGSLAPIRRTGKTEL